MLALEDSKWKSMRYYWDNNSGNMKK